MTTHRALWSLATLAALMLINPVSAEVRKSTGAAALKQQLERLRVVGSVMLIGAHPDDENTALLAYCAQGRKLRTAYLSLTRGEGGQNLIGGEQGDLLGVIRTEELLMARRVDGAEQYFTRAIDFGFSKTADETLAKWGRDKVLADTVWMIRRYRPDVIFLRFSGTPRDGHGHHQSSAMLGKEAYRLAADEKAFPEQLKYVRPWRAKRLLWNGFSFNRQQEQELEKTPARLVADTGDYNDVIGLSYGELAGLSRSQHRTQGMGSAERKGSAPNYFFHYDGDPAKSDFMEGVDTTWNRLAGGAAIQKALDEVAAAYRIDEPEAVIAPLMKARRLIAAIDSDDARRKLVELDDAVAMAAGLWLEVNAARPAVTPGGRLDLRLSAVNRAHADIRLDSVTVGDSVRFAGSALAYNQPYEARAEWQVPVTQPLSQPIQLRGARQGDLYGIADPLDIGPAEAAPVLEAVFHLQAAGEPFEVRRPVEHRYVDRVRGELTRPLVVVPAVALKLGDSALLFPSAQPRTISVEARATVAPVQGSLSLRAPAGWKVEPAEQSFNLSEAGQTGALSFRVTPPATASTGELSAVARAAGQTVDSGLLEITYDHIPAQTVFPAARVMVVREDVKVSVKKAGYIMGAGDAVPEALKELGCEVTLLEAADLSRGDLSRFDVIVAGVRAFNVRADLRANHQRLRDYMERGGTFIVQYNVLEGMGPASEAPPLKNLGPYPLTLGRSRTTVEEAPVTFVKPDHRLLQTPNRISAADFEGWVQERALYFPSDWDPRYEPVLESHDPGEPPQTSGLLYARVGKGVYVFTSYVFFRELPAGVPGAYRLFANLISAGH